MADAAQVAAGLLAALNATNDGVRGQETAKLLTKARESILALLAAECAEGNGHVGSESILDLVARSFVVALGGMGKANQDALVVEPGISG